MFLGYDSPVLRIRIALAQMNPTVGDLEGNCDSVVAFARSANEAGAHMAVFPEMVVTGYSVEDLALRNDFVSASITATHRLAARLAAEGLGEMPSVVGFLSRRAGGRPGPGAPAGAPQNSLAVLHRGAVRLVAAKHHLPNYGVFDEFRYFVPGDALPVLRLHGADIAFAICEDLWQDGGPVSAVREAGAGMLITLNGSPYERHKDDVRLELCGRRARETGAAVGYVNMTGGQDELVFEGDSLIVDANGELLARAPQFEEALLVTDVELPEGPPVAELPGTAAGRPVVRHVIPTAPPARYEAGAPVLTPRPDPVDDTGEVYQALVTGVRDHVRKNGFSSVLVDVSGGVDSALTAAIAADAVGAENVHALLTPGETTTLEETADAEDAVKRGGLVRRLQPVAALADAFRTEIDAAPGALPALEDRVRGGIAAAIAAEEGHLMLATADKSQLAMGLCGHYGDPNGAFAPLKDCWASLVRELARWRNAAAARDGEPAPVPEGCIDRPPRRSAPDGPPLPEQRLLDALLESYIGTDKGVRALIADGFPPDLVRRVVRLVDRAEHIRRAYPPGPKITRRNLGRDRRLPITSRWS